MDYCNVKANSMNKNKCQRIVGLLGQFCNPIRLNLLCALSQKSYTIKDLAKVTGAKLNNVSQHVKLM